MKWGDFIIACKYSANQRKNKFLIYMICFNIKFLAYIRSRLPPPRDQGGWKLDQAMVPVVADR